MSDLNISTVDHHVGIYHPNLTGTELGGVALVELSPAISGPDLVTGDTIDEAQVMGLILNRWVTDVKITASRAGIEIPATAGVPSGGEAKGTGESTFEIAVVPEADGLLTQLFERFVAWEEHPLLVMRFHGGGAITPANPQRRARIVIRQLEDGGAVNAVKTHSFSGKVNGRVMSWNGAAWLQV